jgi:hypothetical protein
MPRSVDAINAPPLVAKSLIDYSKSPVCHRSVSAGVQQRSQDLPRFCAGLLDWQHPSEPEVDADPSDVTFQVKRERLERYYKNNKILYETRNDKGLETKKKNSSRRQDLAVTINKDTGLPQVQQQQHAQEVQSLQLAAPPALSKSRVRRRASIGYFVNSDGGAAAEYTPQPLRRHASLTELGDRLKQLPGQREPKAPIMKQSRRGSGTYTNNMTQQLEVTILNADKPRENETRQLRRSSLGGGGSMHSCASTSSIHSTSALGGDESTNQYGYNDDPASTSYKMDASQAMRRMRRTSFGGCKPGSEGDPYGYGDYAPNIRVLSATVTYPSTSGVDTAHALQRMRRSSIGGSASSSASTDMYGYDDPAANVGLSSGSDMNSNKSMRRARRCSVGGLDASSRNGMAEYQSSHGCGMVSNKASSLTQTDHDADAEHGSQEHKVRDTSDRFGETGHSVSLAQPSLSQPNGNEAEEHAESRRSLEQLVLELSGHSKRKCDGGKEDPLRCPGRLLES